MLHVISVSRSSPRMLPFPRHNFIKFINQKSDWNCWRTFWTWLHHNKSPLILIELDFFSGNSFYSQIESILFSVLYLYTIFNKYIQQKVTTVVVLISKPVSFAFSLSCTASFRIFVYLTFHTIKLLLVMKWSVAHN